MPTNHRSIFAGMTDYTAVPMEVIISDLRDWRDNTVRSIEELKQLKAKVEAYQDRLDWPDDKMAHLSHFIELFGRYVGDFERLLTELPDGVRDAHIQIVRQLYNSAAREESLCVIFKDEHIERALKDEGLRWLVDNIYCDSRSTLINYKDLSNLVPRLRTFIGTKTGARGGSVSAEKAWAAHGKAKVQAPLPPKKMDLARWMDEAALTGKQRDCFSLRMEYGLSVSEISRRLGISRPSVDKHIAAANRKINQGHANNCSTRRLVPKRKPE